MSSIPNLKKMLVIFVLALLIRGFFFIQVMERTEVIFQPDSSSYEALARGLATHRSFVNIDKPDIYEVKRMPGYPFFLALIMSIFNGNIIAVVFIQIIIDCLSCILIGHLSEKIVENTGMLSGILAAINLNMITYAHFILTDSLFLFLFIILLIIFLRFMGDPGWGHALLLGFILGVSVYVRPVILYFPLPLILFLLFFLSIHKRLPIINIFLKIFIIAVVFLLTLSPWYIRNYVHYGRFQLMAQSGKHSLQYVVPFIWQYSKGIPFSEGMEIAEERFIDRARSMGIDLKEMTPFENSSLQSRVAMDLAKDEPLSAIFKAWTFGMIKNLFSPAVIDTSYLLNIERPHFFTSQGITFIERGKNFIAGLQGIFSWFVIGNIILMILFRIIQFHGFILLFRRRLWYGLVLMLVMFYFLIISGPVGYAKYRLPLEPVFIILLSFPVIDVYRHAFSNLITRFLNKNAL